MDIRQTSQTDFMQRISVHWLFHEVDSFRLQVHCMTSITFVSDKDYAVWYESIHRIGFKISKKTSRSKHLKVLKRHISSQVQVFFHGFQTKPHLYS